LPAEGGVDAEARIVIQELGDAPGGRRLKLGPHGLPNDLPDGLQTLPLSGGTWRVLVRTRADGSRVAVAQPTAARDEIARDSAVRTILPLGVLIPCLMLLVGLVIHTSFRPVLNLASRLDVKESGHLEKLPTDGIPTELHPFIESINRLLQRTAVLFEHQRRFIADAAHELRTPITALSIQAENLGHEDLAEESRTLLAALRSGIRRTAHLAEQLLDLARYDENNLADVQVVKLDAIVKKAVSEFLPFARARSIDIGFDRIEDAPVRGIPTGLAALTRNLIDNAIRYSPDGDKLTLMCQAKAITSSSGSTIAVRVSRKRSSIAFSSRSTVETGRKGMVRGSGCRSCGALSTITTDRSVSRTARPPAGLACARSSHSSGLDACRVKPVVRAALQ
jgi:two-component system, OmpR family, sensor kinase